MYKKYKKIRPKISLYCKEFVKPITSLGSQFFIIQIAIIIIFTTDKILITQIFGPEYVTQYDVVFKLFSIITIIHSILIAPLWPAYADSYHKGDFEWIKSNLKRQIKLFILFIICTFILFINANLVFSIWIGKEIVTDECLILFMVVFVLVSTWNNIFGCILSGMDKVRFSAFSAIIGAVVNIPLSIYFSSEIGLSGIVLATVVSISFSAFFHPIRVFYFLFCKRKSKKLTKLFS